MTLATLTRLSQEPTLLTPIPKHQSGNTLAQPLAWDSVVRLQPQHPSSSQLAVARSPRRIDVVAFLHLYIEFMVPDPETQTTMKKYGV